MSKKEKLELRSINDLLKEKFYIPSYQRGYRWNKRQVKELLNDIWEFYLNSQNGSKEKFYCLQPLIVSKNNGEWEVVDGQQRLTTIYLILNYLKEGLSFLGKQKYQIRYDTRPESASFLENIDLKQKDTNIDLYHICDAHEAIDEWFNSNDGNARINLLITLVNDNVSGKNVKVIWYDISDENKDNGYAIEVFTRINLGKIPLTNAELIKAMFLGKANQNVELSKNEVDKEIQKHMESMVHLKRLQIASEWDRIEYTLQKEEFWNFIYEGEQKYDTRIEYIFDLMTEKPDDAEPHYTFHKFDTILKTTSIDDLWLRIKNFYQVLQDWYNDRELYHYIGFLIANNEDVYKLKDEYDKTARSVFKTNVIKKIARKLDFEVDSLRYSDARIKPVLLIFNIQTLLSNDNCQSRFPFDLFKRERWDIEHIRSVQSDMPTGPKMRNWLEVVLTYFTGIQEFGNLNLHEEKIFELEVEEGKTIAQSIFNLLAYTKIEAHLFSKTYNQVLKYFAEGNDPDWIDRISNLALLDAETNREYKNSPFPVKRRTILEKDKKGTYIPLCTRNVFLKTYSKRLSNSMFWQKEDATAYLEEIRKSVEFFTNHLKVEVNEQ